MTAGISPRNLLTSRAAKYAAQFSFRARQTDALNPEAHQIVLADMVDTIAKAFSADRTTFYHLDPFGHLHVHTANTPEIMRNSHVRDVAPDGPLAEVINNHGFIFIPDVLQPNDYLLLNGEGHFSRLPEGSCLNREVRERYANNFGPNFTRTKQPMSMIFGSLWDQGKTFGAFKADSFLSGRSILPDKMNPEDLLNIAATIGNQAASSLAALTDRMELARQKKETEKQYETARGLLMKIAHAFTGRLTVPHGYLQVARTALASTPNSLAEAQIAKAKNYIEATAAYVREYVEPVRAGSFEISYKRLPVTLDKLIEEVSGLGIEVEAGELPKTIFTDGEKVKDVLLGLIENARKYTPLRGGIKVGVRMVKNEVEFRVKDQGLGLTADQLTRVFDGGQRFHADMIPGSGCGLKGFKEIVEKLGGRIWARSAGPDKGSTFYFTLPLKIDAG